MNLRTSLEEFSVKFFCPRSWHERREKVSFGEEKKENAQQVLFIITLEKGPKVPRTLTLVRGL